MANISVASRGFKHKYYSRAQLTSLRPRPTDVLSLTRPALGLAAACGLPGFLLYQKHGIYLIPWLLLAFLWLAKSKIWRLPWLKYALAVVFILNLARAYGGLAFASRYEKASLSAKYGLGRVLWASSATDQVCLEARLNGGQKVALVVPSSCRNKTWLSAEVTLARPDVGSNPGSFDEAAWLAGQGIFLKGQVQNLLELSPSEAHFRAWRSKSYEDIRDALIKQMKPESTGLLMSICLGDKSGLSYLTKYDLHSLSLAHLTAVSGLHLAYLLAGLKILPLASILGKKLDLCCKYFLVLVFYGFTGRPPGLLRAGLVLAIKDLSNLGKLRPDPLNSLALALTISCLINPFALLNRGLLWSYTAAASLFLFADPLTLSLQEGLPHLSAKAVRALAAILTAQTAISLLNLSAQKNFNLLNLLWQLPLALLAQLIFLGGLPLLFSLVICPGLASHQGFLLKSWTWLLDQLALIFLRSCQSLNTISWPSLLQVPLKPGLVLALVLLAASQLYSRRRRSWSAFHLRRKLLRQICWGLVVVTYLFTYVNPAPPCVYALDVGQGDALVISYGKRHMLIDGGTSDQAWAVLLPFMASKGILYFDSALITHAHEDHLGAALELMARGKIRSLYLPAEFSFPERLARYLGEEPSPESLARLQVSQSGERERGEEALDLAEAHNLPVFRLKPGDQITWQSNTLARPFLPPLYLKVSQASQSDSKQFSDANETGLVACLNWGQTKFLLTGDITPRKEDLFISAGEGSSAILKVGHHGARNVSTNEFLRSVNPRLALISVGPNHYGHPSPEVLRRLEDQGIACLRTDQDGAIKISWNSKGKCRVESYKSKKRISGLE